MGQDQSRPDIRIPADHILVLQPQFIKVDIQSKENKSVLTVRTDNSYTTKKQQSTIEYIKQMKKRPPDSDIPIVERTKSSNIQRVCSNFNSNEIYAHSNRPTHKPIEFTGLEALPSPILRSEPHTIMIDQTIDAINRIHAKRHPQPSNRVLSQASSQGNITIQNKTFSLEPKRIPEINFASVDALRRDTSILSIQKVLVSTETQTKTPPRSDECDATLQLKTQKSTQNDRSLHQDTYSNLQDQRNIFESNKNSIPRIESYSHTPKINKETEVSISNSGSYPIFKSEISNINMIIGDTSNMVDISNQKSVPASPFISHNQSSRQQRSSRTPLNVTDRPIEPSIEPSIEPQISQPKFSASNVNQMTPIPAVASEGEPTQFKKAIKLDFNFDTEPKNKTLADCFKARQKHNHTQSREISAPPSRQRDPISQFQSQDQPSKQENQQEHHSPAKGRSREEQIRLRREMMNYGRSVRDIKSPPQTRPQSPNPPSRFESPLLQRLAMGVKVKVPKKEMYALTKKNYENLPEVKRKKNEEEKKQQQSEFLKSRKNKIKEMEREIRNRLFKRKE